MWGEGRNNEGHRATSRSFFWLEGPQNICVQSWLRDWSQSSTSSLFPRNSWLLVSGCQTESFQMKKQSGFPLQAIKAEHLVGLYQRRALSTSSFPNMTQRCFCRVINAFARKAPQREYKQKGVHGCNNTCPFVSVQNVGGWPEDQQRWGRSRTKGERPHAVRIYANHPSLQLSLHLSSNQLCIHIH